MRAVCGHGLGYLAAVQSADIGLANVFILSLLGVTSPSDP